MPLERIPLGKALATAVVLSLVHFGLCWVLLLVGVAGRFYPVLVGLRLLTLPLDLAYSGPVFLIAACLNSLAYGLAASWAYYSLRARRRGRRALVARWRIGTVMVVIGLIALFLVEFQYRETAPIVADDERRALAEASSSETIARNWHQIAARKRQKAGADALDPAARAKADGDVAFALKVADEYSDCARGQREQAARFARLKQRPWTREVALALTGLWLLSKGVGAWRGCRTAAAASTVPAPAFPDDAIAGHGQGPL